MTREQHRDEIDGETASWCVPSGCDDPQHVAAFNRYLRDLR